MYSRLSEVYTFPLHIYEKPFVLPGKTEHFRYRRRQETASSTSIEKKQVDKSVDKLQLLKRQLDANIDCKVQWGEWSSCFMDNGSYIQSRNATISQYPQNAGAPCRPLTETRPCTTADCQMSNWGDWSNCYKDDDSKSDTYNKYIQIKTRNIVSPPTGMGKGCDSLFEKQVCQPVNCNVRLLNETESPWSLCASQPNGTYEQIRIKYEVTSPPENGGTCPSSEGLLERRTCAPKNCELGPWSTPSGCYRDDKGGYIKLQTREIRKEAQNGGTCTDPLTQTIPCTPEDCKMSDWSSWSDCYINPDGRWYHLRTREITQSARYNGKECGLLTEEELCPSRDCQIKGDWTDYGPCYLKENGVSYKIQTRDFDDAINGGKSCEENDFIREVNC